MTPYDRPDDITFARTHRPGIEVMSTVNKHGSLIVLWADGERWQFDKAIDDRWVFARKMPSIVDKDNPSV